MVDEATSQNLKPAYNSFYYTWTKYMKAHSKQLKMNTRRIFLTLLFCLVASAQAATGDCCVESTKQVLNSKESKDKAIDLESDLSNKSLPKIYPYVNAKMLQDFDAHSKTGVGLDVFIPIFTANTGLYFSNLKLNNYSNKTFDGGIYFGYRHLLLEDQGLFGIYTSFDFNKTERNEYLKQVTLGTEYWIHQWFFGSKIFGSIGGSENSYEQVVPGIGAEIGYEFSKKSTVYFEGYYLNTSSMGKVPGARVKLKQNLFSKATNSGMLDKVDLEVGVQKDKLTGNRVFAELIFRMGASSNVSTPDGVAAHMSDTISKSRIFIERTPQTDGVFTDGVFKGKKTMEVECFYFKSTKALAKGSSSLCPVTYEDATSGKYDITETSEDRVFLGMHIMAPRKK